MTVWSSGQSPQLPPVRSPMQEDAPLTEDAPLADGPGSQGPAPSGAGAGLPRAGTAASAEPPSAEPADLAYEPPAMPHLPVAPAGQQSASPELFERAVHLHSRRLLAIARAIVGNRASPEDVVQQAVTNLFQHRHRYDWREPGGLLKRAVVNEALRLLRPPRMTPVADEQPDRAGYRSGGPVDEMIGDETIQQVRRAIARLPDHFRAALVLCEYENFSYVEIAQTLGASVPQVKTWLHRARRQLAGMLEGYVSPGR